MKVKYISIFMFCLFSIAKVYGQIDKTTIAVFNFYTRGVSEAEALAITGNLRAEIRKTGRYDVIENNKTNLIFEEQTHQGTNPCFEPSCLAKIGKLIAVKQIIGGSIVKKDDLFTIEAHIVDVESGQILTNLPGYFNISFEGIMAIVTKEIAHKLSGLSNELPKEETQSYFSGNSELYVRSNPAGGTIYINEQPIKNVTPFKIQRLSEGVYHIRVTKDGLIGEQVVSLKLEETKKLNIELKESNYTINITSDPPDAEIWANGRKVGKTPLELKTIWKGLTVDFKILKKGFAAYKVSIKIGDENLYQINAKLETGGAVVVSSEPSLARIYLDGEEIGRTPFAIANLPLGEHSLQIERTLYEPYSDVFTLHSKEPIKLSYKLEPKKTALTLETNIGGADVYMGEIYLGKTPLKSKLIPQGEHEIKIKKKGFHIIKRKIFPNNSSMQLDFTLYPLRKRTAIIKSLFIPGFGQRYSGYEKRGARYFMAEIALIGGYYAMSNRFSKDRDQYQSDRTAYLEANTSEDIQQGFSTMKNSYDRANSTKNVLLVFGGSAIGLWLWNVVDAVIFFPQPENSINTSNMHIKPELTTNKISVSATINF